MAMFELSRLNHTEIVFEIRLLYRISPEAKQLFLAMFELHILQSYMVKSKDTPKSQYEHHTQKQWLIICIQGSPLVVLRICRRFAAFICMIQKSFTNIFFRPVS